MRYRLALTTIATAFVLAGGLGSHVHAESRLISEVRKGRSVTAQLFLDGATFRVPAGKRLAVVGNGGTSRSFADAAERMGYQVLGPARTSALLAGGSFDANRLEAASLGDMRAAADSLCKTSPIDWVIINSSQSAGAEARLFRSPKGILRGHSLFADCEADRVHDIDVEIVMRMPLDPAVPEVMGSDWASAMLTPATSTGH